MDDSEAFGHLLRRLRKGRDLTQAALAEQAGCASDTIKKIEHHGGKICVPKMAIPKIGWLAYAEDPAGNVFGVIEPNTNAK